MLVARRLYELAHGQASGTLRLVHAARTTAPLDVELFHGWVHAVDLSPAYSLVGDAPERGEDRLRVWLKLAPGEPGAAYELESFFADAKPRKRGACPPFHPAATVRNHVDGHGPPPRYFAARLGGGTVQLSSTARAPHASCLGQDERPLLALLQRPRTLAELAQTNVCPPPRIERLLAFLDQVGALIVTSDGLPSPWAVLELPDGAPLDDVKRAFRRLARELHPDRHPGLDEPARRELERRFAEVSAAYEKLV